MLGRLQLAAELHLQPLSRELDGRERVFDLVRQAARHFAPGLGALGRDDVRDVVKHQKAAAVGQYGTARDQGLGPVRAAGHALTGRAQLERLLPVVVRLLQATAQKLGKLLLHAHRKGLQPGQLAQGGAPKTLQRQLQNTRRARVGRAHAAVGIEHQHARSQVVQNGLQMRARRIHLRHAALHRAAGVCELLGHGRKSAGQAAQLVIALHGQLGRQVARGHLAHAFGQHQQGPGNLVAQNHRQQNRAKHGQKQAQRQGADVHALEAFAGQRALLVFAVGAFYGQGVGHKIGGQGALHQQKTLLGGQAHAGAGNGHQGLDARAAQLAGAALFQALDPGQ